MRCASTAKRVHDGRVKPPPAVTHGKSLPTGAATGGGAPPRGGRSEDAAVQPVFTASPSPPSPPKPGYPPTPLLVGAAAALVFALSSAYYLSSSAPDPVVTVERRDVAEPVVESVVELTAPVAEAPPPLEKEQVRSPDVEHPDPDEVVKPGMYTPLQLLLSSEGVEPAATVQEEPAHAETKVDASTLFEATEAARDAAAEHAHAETEVDASTLFEAAEAARDAAAEHKVSALRSAGETAANAAEESAAEGASRLSAARAAFMTARDERASYMAALSSTAASERSAAVSSAAALAATTSAARLAADRDSTAARLASAAAQTDALAASSQARDVVLLAKAASSLSLASLRLSSALEAGHTPLSDALRVPPTVWSLATGAAAASVSSFASAGVAPVSELQDSFAVACNSLRTLSLLPLRPDGARHSVVARWLSQLASAVRVTPFETSSRSVDSSIKRAEHFASSGLWVEAALALEQAAAGTAAQDPVAVWAAAARKRALAEQALAIVRGECFCALAALKSQAA